MYGSLFSQSEATQSLPLWMASTYQPVREVDMAKKVYASLEELPRAEKPKHPRFKDLTGQKFGRLTAIQFVGKGKWGCQCECGTLVAVSGDHLTRGHTSSCGCLHRELAAQGNITHGDCGTKLYSVWRNILTRCYNAENRAYPSYGGRGVTEEFGSFEAFRDYVNTNLGSTPSPDCSLDRIDNGGNYAPGNLRWATRTQQNRNKRSNHLVVFDGREMPLVEACELAGVTYAAATLRITRRGWTPEKALTTPVRPMRSQKPPTTTQATTS